MTATMSGRSRFGAERFLLPPVNALSSYRPGRQVQPLDFWLAMYTSPATLSFQRVEVQFEIYAAERQRILETFDKLQNRR